MNAVVNSADGHVCHTGRYDTDFFGVGVQHYSGIVKGNLARIVPYKRMCVVRLVLKFQNVVPDEALGKCCLVVVVRKRKGPRMVDERPRPDILMDSGRTAPALSESLAARPQGITPKSAPASSTISHTRISFDWSTNNSNPNSPV